MLVHTATTRQLLLGEQILESVAFHHAHIGIAREFGDEHLGHSLAERRVVGGPHQRGVGEIHDRHRWASVILRPGIWC